MNERDLSTRLLGTPSEDAGGEATLAALAEYVEGELEGRNVAQLMRAVAEAWELPRLPRGLRRPARARPPATHRLAHARSATRRSRPRRLLRDARLVAERRGPARASRPFDATPRAS